MSTSEPPTDEELQAAYETEMQRLRVEQILLESVVTLINLGMRRTGLGPGTEGERDLAQVQLAIESVRALVPVLERVAPEQARQVRDALSQVQLAYVRIGGQAAGAGAGAGAASASGTGEPGAAPGEGARAPGAGQAPAAGVPGAAPSEAGTAAGEARREPDPAPAAEPPKPGEPGPAQRSGRLWVPNR